MFCYFMLEQNVYDYVNRSVYQIGGVFSRLLIVDRLFLSTKMFILKPVFLTFSAKVGFQNDHFFMKKSASTMSALGNTPTFSVHIA